MANATALIDPRPGVDDETLQTVSDRVGGESRPGVSEIGGHTAIERGEGEDLVGVETFGAPAGLGDQRIEVVVVDGEGLKSINLEKLLVKAPERVIETAVRGMMPKNKLGRAMFKKLRVYAGSEHQHTAQQPIALDI